MPVKLHPLLLHVECALEDEVFEDGAETRMECNKCVCACGNWVCTALTCTGRVALLACVIQIFL